MSPVVPTAALDALRGRLVVSCQATEAEALHGPHHMTAMARSVLAGGAAGLRLEGPADIAAVRAVTDVPIIGLWKIGRTGVYITPTVDAVRAVLAAGADIVAVDATGRDRPDGSTLADLVAITHDAGGLVMADVATVEHGIAAHDAGVDVVSTTLSGYLGPGPVPTGPDLDLVAAMVAAVDLPVIAEGRIHTPAAAAQALRLGAHAVVVGGAITRPAQITERFVAGLLGPE